MQAQHRFLRITEVFRVATLAAVLSVPVGIAQQKPEKSLYDRLGDVYSIATVVDDFIERLLINDILNANPAIKKARSRRCICVRF